MFGTIIQSNYNWYCAALRNFEEDKNGIGLGCVLGGIFFVFGFGFVLFFKYLPMLSHLVPCTLTIFADPELNFCYFPKSLCSVQEAYAVFHKVVM